MRIRRLAVPDVAAYRAVRLRALREHPDAFTSSYEEDAVLPQQVAEARLASSSFAAWGAFEAEALLGIVGLDRERRAKSRHKGTVIGMYVAPEGRGQGVGRALLDAVVSHARETGLQSLVLTVTEGNVAAQRLYEAAGFRSFGIEPDAVRVGTHSFAKNHMYLDLR
jgi:ribosomal protein S18 acetylase RimI-like enzyme